MQEASWPAKSRGLLSCAADLTCRSQAVQALQFEEVLESVRWRAAALLVGKSKPGTTLLCLLCISLSTQQLRVLLLIWPVLLLTCLCS